MPISLIFQRTASDISLETFMQKNVSSKGGQVRESMG